MSASAPHALQPTSLEEVQTCVQEAAGGGGPLELLGGGSKRGYGGAVQGARELALGGLRGIVDYQPHELILVAKPGTPLAEVEATLAAAGQMLAFEPPHWGPTATLGGTVGCNLAGPRRPKAGAARDHLLGFQAVTGTGEAVRGGGRVVKNVTGYDLPKLFCGSFGTLAVFTELVLKVLPAAETESTVLFAGLDAAAGVGRLIAASRTQHEPSALAHLPAGLALPAGLSLPAQALAGAAGTNGVSLTAIRVEGPEPSVRLRRERLAAGNGGGAGAVPAAGWLDGADSRAFWLAVRELAPLAWGQQSAEPLPLGPTERLWRLSVPPSAGAALGAQLETLGEARLLYDWGGGLVWAALPARHAPAAVHRLAQAHGGHGQVVRHGAECPVLQPLFAELAPGARRLQENLKRAFDPHGIFNPGRMYPDL